MPINLPNSFSKKSGYLWLLLQVETGALQELMFLHSDESNDFAYTIQVDSDDEDGDHRSILNEKTTKAVVGKGDRIPSGLPRTPR